MATEKYETERVPVPRKTRILHGVVSCVCIAAGVMLVVPTIIEPSGPDAYVPRFYGFLVGGAGILFLIRTIRRTHEPMLTEQGRAAKAADDRIAQERQAKRDAVFMNFAFWAAVMFGIVYFYDPIVDMLEKRVAVYPVYCVSKIPATGKCANGGERAANVTKYIVRVEQQIVVGLTDGAPEPSKLFNCAVADLENWSCTLDSNKDSTRAVMRDGEFSYNPPSPWLSEFRYTSRWKYLVARYLNDK